MFALVYTEAEHIADPVAPLVVISCPVRERLESQLRLPLPRLLGLAAMREPSEAAARRWSYRASLGEDCQGEADLRVLTDQTRSRSEPADLKSSVGKGEPEAVGEATWA